LLTVVLLSGLFFGLGVAFYRADYQGIALQQRRLFLASSKQRTLGPEELIAERKILDADARRLPGFRRLGDFVELYPEDPTLSQFSKNPYRALVDDDGTTVALIFRISELMQVKENAVITYRDDTTRVSLSTAFSNGRWIVTQKKFGLANKKPIFPPEIDVVDFDWEIPLSELVAKHAARVAAATDHPEEAYRGAARADRVIIRTLDEFLADHRKRRELIRAKENAH
jgi:hypothetical protein